MPIPSFKTDSVNIVIKFFDNFIYDGEKVYLIDFDRTIITSLDYDMMIFKTMCENPSKFANEEDEDNIIDSEYKNIYQ